MLRRGLFIGRACFGVSFLNSTNEHFAVRSILLPCDPIVTRIGIYRSSTLSVFGIAMAFGSFSNCAGRAGMSLRRHGGLDDATGSETPQRSLVPNARAYGSGETRERRAGNGSRGRISQARPKCSRSRRVFEACSRYPRIVSDPGLATPNEGLIRVRVHTEITPLQCAAIWTPGGHRWRSRKHLWPAAGISVRRRGSLL